jgi:N-formylglutamate deformylase
MILHIPHASKTIPKEYRNQFLLSDTELEAELLLMTDSYTDELYCHPQASIAHFPLSRLLVDVERFSDDAQEPMSQVGMGMIYTKTAAGRLLRRHLSEQERHELVNSYHAHHIRLQELVKNELDESGQALIVDCHSFPNVPLKCHLDRSPDRPDICIGTDEFHTPTNLLQSAKNAFEDTSLRIGINTPYAGALVPLLFYRKDPRVMSIMIEINRKLYMDSTSGDKRDAFGGIQKAVSSVLDVLHRFMGN